MIDTLNIIEIIVSILLIFIILIQNKSVTLNLSSMWGAMGSTTKRWPEKILQNMTIILSIIFWLNSLLFFLLK